MQSYKQLHIDEKRRELKGEGEVKLKYEAAREGWFKDYVNEGALMNKKSR